MAVKTKLGGGGFSLIYLGTSTHAKVGGSVHDYFGVKIRDHRTTINTNLSETRIYRQSMARQTCQNYPTDPTPPSPIEITF